MKSQGRVEMSDCCTGSWEDVDHLMKTRSSMKLEDQLFLSDSDLKEEFSRVLLQENPKIDDNLIEFSHKENCFVSVPADTYAELLYDQQSLVVYKDSDEASDVQDKSPSMPKTGNGESSEEILSLEADNKSVTAEEEQTTEGEREEDKEEDLEQKDVALSERSSGPKKITNQFNFCERAAMTSHNTTRIVATQTIPPPRSIFSKQICQYTIYDGYLEDFENQKQEKSKEKEKKEKSLQQQINSTKNPTRRKLNVFEVSEVTNRMICAAKILERMVNQNIFDDIAQDYRYWEDPSDEFRDEEGTLLPLWKLSYEKTKKCTITEICWNPHYYDMVAVAYGTFDFMKSKSDGAVCIYTLKNPSYPEYVCVTDAAVMSVDIHPTHSHLLVIGKSNGSVAVYNTRSTSNQPQYKSNSLKNKHTNIVWQVKWGKNLPDGEINFYSIGADGYVNNWVITQKDLTKSTVIPLYMNVYPKTGPDGIVVHLKGCGTAIAFHPQEPMIFLVGTEEGYVHKCSTAYTSMFLLSYKAHDMPIHRINYNKFYPFIFLSCSADWRIKMWEENRSDPLFVFDVGSSIGDVEWAPYSSTVFACVTNDGKVHVFDININKYKPICSQSVVSKKKNKLTRLTFNAKLPIIIVGDDRGSVSTLKLSPNLRKKVKPPKKGPPADPTSLEIKKLEKLLALVRVPRGTPSNISVPNSD